MADNRYPWEADAIANAAKYRHMLESVVQGRNVDLESATTYIPKNLNVRGYVRHSRDSGMPISPTFVAANGANAQTIAHEQNHARLGDKWLSRGMLSDELTTEQAIFIRKLAEKIADEADKDVGEIWPSNMGDNVDEVFASLAGFLGNQAKGTRLDQLDLAKAIVGAKGSEGMLTASHITSPIKQPQPLGDFMTGTAEEKRLRNLPRETPQLSPLDEAIAWLRASTK